MAKSRSKKLPRFRSLDELVAFFDTHDLGDYLDKMPEAHFEVDLKRDIHLVAIDPELADEVTRIARSKRMTSGRLINSWLREKVREQA
ncbi:MAG: hypothetical protein A3F84_07070 [Candidatus Handelsmanbacteria bacterium RIFCSPLOWO2_12_FULL_64_10]|uniref:Uncharacterized protein n=1 Tax=Handelsmanbacteria sp. (strain RIFCSPLOWO2_12_FULL_64_10) TaxID=1817868 RepID=A0A1F6C5W2_HANXR|nr:MAG: hypothetical protein A3F84_07070 [Candidatus Handelsmanbacteria bacterium RIFCSPLOWO2_12_FULL_64_10]